jgi:hypothetical protein
MKLNFAFSPQNVSNAEDTIFQVNAGNVNKILQNVQTVTNNIRATIKHNIQGSELASAKHSNANKQNAPCLTKHNFPNLPPLSSTFNWHNPRKPYPTISHPRKIDKYISQMKNRNDGKTLCELIKEITSILQDCNISPVILTD